MAAAQGGIYVKASVDKNKILIGEPIQLTVEAQIPGDAVIRFFQIDSIAHFEFLEKPHIDTIKTGSGITIKGLFKITSFDSGYWTIPSFVLSRNVKTNTIPVDVVFSDFDPTKDYHDIKDIIEVNPEKEKNWWWYIALSAVLLTAMVIWFLRRKKKPIIAFVPIIDPYKEAMQGLEQIQKQNISGKEYYSALINIFRLFILKKKGIQSLQKTTDDLVIQIRSLHMTKEQFDQLSSALRLSDFVKFAKYIPAKEDDQVVFDTIKRSIQAIEQMN